MALSVNPRNGLNKPVDSSHTQKGWLAGDMHCQDSQLLSCSW